MAPGDGVRVRSKKGKFIGGAAAARRRATKIENPLKREKLKAGIPFSVPAHERLLASILRSLPQEIIDSETKWESRKLLVDAIYHRLDLPQPAMLKSKYNKIEDHYAAYASLVTEETRQTIASALCKRWLSKPDPKSSILIDCISYEQPKKSQHPVYFFQADRPLTPEQRYNLRLGTVVEMLPNGCFDTERIVLGSIVQLTPKRNMQFEDEDNLGSCDPRLVSVMIYNNSDKIGKGMRMSFIASVLNFQRQFEACTSSAKTSFGGQLLGHRRSHVRFDDSDHTKCKAEATEKASHIPDIDENLAVKTEAEPHDPAGSPGTGDYFCRTSACTSFPVTHKGGGGGGEGKVGEDIAPASKPTFQIPSLNASQLEATNTFLNSQENCISIVQGPPGTGKTTMTVSIICRYLLQLMRDERTKRLLVCGPTNKSVTVIAGRLFGCIGDVPNVNVVLIGDKDRLLAENRADIERSLVYTFLPAMVKDWKALSNDLKRRKITHMDFLARSKKLSSKLRVQLASFFDDTLKSLIGKVEKIAAAVSSEDSKRFKTSVDSIQAVIDRLCKIFESWDERMVVLELLNSAHVIFCTLTSAGSGLVKKMAPIDDLIVDEASAATEPELYIPFHLKPNRLLLVGDPSQLPAAVQSKTAKRFGLTKSLQERLMHDCGFDFVMLDVQYRMRPEISQWPLSLFYDGNVRDGDNVKSNAYRGSTSLLMGQPYTFLQVEGTEQKDALGSSFNTEECRVIVSLLRDLQLRSQSSWCSVHQIRIITFYQAQVAVLQAHLRRNGLGGGGVVVSTVDSSQGCESDIVIVSFVRGSEGRVGFLQDCRRLNVALTRAKFQLICVGNANAMAKFNDADSLRTIKGLAVDAISRNCVSVYAPRSMPPYSAGGKRKLLERKGNNSEDILTKHQRKRNATNNTRRHRKTELPKRENRGSSFN